MKMIFAAACTVLLCQTVSHASAAQTATESPEVKEIRQVLAANAHAYTVRDKAGICAMYKNAGENLLFFDLVPPREDRGFQKACVEKVSRFVDGTTGPIVSEYGDPQIHVIDHDHAWVTSHVRFSFTQKSGQKTQADEARSTQIFQRIKGAWTVVHEHSSVPSKVGFSCSE